MKRFLPLLALAFAATAWADELTADGNFEKDVIGMAGPDPQIWSRFASTEPMGLQIVQNPLQKGSQALRIEAREEAGAYQGLFQTIPVQPGKKYLATLQVLDDSGAPLKRGSTGLLSVEWRDRDGNEVGREDGKPWSSEISPSQWQTVALEAAAPAGATQAHFVILQRNPENASDAAGGAFLVDDFSVIEK